MCKILIRFILLIFSWYSKLAVMKSQNSIFGIPLEIIVTIIVFIIVVVVVIVTNHL